MTASTTPSAAHAANQAAKGNGAEERADERDREIARLRQINQALMERVERSLDQQGNAFSLFQTAIGLEAQVRRRTSELTHTLADLEQSNVELKFARDAAENASHTKTQFLAAASHDVLQPLNAALLSMSSLTTVQASTEGHRLCRQVERSLETMDSLLRTLLYMSRLDSGDVVPDIEGVSLDDLFDSIASDFEPVARLSGLELRVRRGGLYVQSDATMLRRVLQNIVANALRYTHEGGVLLIAGARGKTVYVRVADTGIGIEKDRYREVFVEFNRSKARVDSEDAAAGLGLGLAIVERLMRTLGHTVHLNSRVGHGSCFRLSLPRGKGATPRKRRQILQTDGNGLAGARLLVIENDIVALQAMDALLGQWRCEIRLASSTEEALSALEEGGFVPDVIVADHHLNGADRGLYAIGAMRSSLGRDVPALLVTANPSNKLRRLAELGRIELMEKPLKPAELRALLTHLR